MLRKPEPGECEEYYFLYIDQVPEEGILECLEHQAEEVAGLFASLPPELETATYRPGKWTPREMLGHVADAERVFGFRAFCFARGDTAPLPSMDQDDYAAAADYRERPMAEIADEYRAVRAATLALFHSFDDRAWAREGVASGFRFTVRTFPYVLAGHERHHCRVLCDRYLPAGVDGIRRPAWIDPRAP